jgi:predicted NACHT family NTPase
VRQAREVIRTFEDTLHSANECVDTKQPRNEKLLESSSMLDYCQVECASTRVPVALAPAATPAQTIQLDETFLESTKANILISGPAGFGKTSFCRWQTLHDLRRFRNNECDVIPVYIPLHRYAQGELANFETTFLKAPELIELWRGRTKHNETRRFRLYLDGLDEVPSIQRQQQLSELALEGKRADPTLSLIVTGREHVFGKHLRHFVRIHVCEFDEQQIAQLASKWSDDDQHMTEEFFTQLTKVPSLKRLMSVPLLATLILGVYRSTKTLPESRVRLYDMFVSLLAGGWDAAKGIQREARFGPAPKHIVLTKLAATLHLNRRRDCSQIDFRNAVSNTLSGLNTEWEGLLEETLRDGLLISIGVNYAFAHLSFQEFLSAKDLFEPTGRKAARAFRSYLSGDDWWKDVAFFYIALSSDPKDLEHFIKDCAQQVLSKTARPSVVSRMHALLEELMVCFSGAQPNFQLNEL